MHDRTVPMAALLGVALALTAACSAQPDKAPPEGDLCGLLIKEEMANAIHPQAKPGAATRNVSNCSYSFDSEESGYVTVDISYEAEQPHSSDEPFDFRGYEATRARDGSSWCTISLPLADDDDRVLQTRVAILDAEVDTSCDHAKALFDYAYDKLPPAA